MFGGIFTFSRHVERKEILVIKIKKFIITGLALAAVVASPLLSTAQAHAGAPVSYTTGGVYIRSGSNTSALAFGMGYPSQSATLLCIARGGQNVSGNTSWWRHINTTTGKTGYSSAHYMYIKALAYINPIPYSTGKTC